MRRRPRLAILTSRRPLRRPLSRLARSAQLFDSLITRYEGSEGVGWRRSRRLSACDWLKPRVGELPQHARLRRDGDAVNALEPSGAIERVKPSAGPLRA